MNKIIVFLCFVRIHQNDIETIPMFIFIALLYVLSDPNSWIALWHFRIFTGARVMYMFAYEVSEILFLLFKFCSIFWENSISIKNYFFQMSCSAKLYHTDSSLLGHATGGHGVICDTNRCGVN